MTSGSRAGLALGLAILLALGGTVAAPGQDEPLPTRSTFGVNVHAPEEEHLRFLLAKTAQAGIGWIRIDFTWAAIEPAPGVEEWRVYDDLVAVARERNLRILALVGYTPAWATDGPEIAGVPRDARDWADFCYRAARRYRDDIHHWEIWNEPNLPRFWVGSREEYVETILAPASRAIRAANPEARIGGPALAHFTGDGRDWHAWLLEILDRGGEELDFVTHHVYDLEDPRGVGRKLAERTPAGSHPALWSRFAPSVREVLDYAGWTKPVWLTETGWVSTRLDETRQARQYGRFLDLWSSDGSGLRSWLEKVFFYEIQDAAPPQFAKYGLLRVSGREKPAYRVLREFLAGLGTPGGDEGPVTRRPEPPRRIDRPGRP